MAFSPSEEKRDTHARAQKKEREKREFLCGSKKRDFSDDDDDDEGVYIFLSEKKMAQRSPRKSLQLNRANTPINFSGPMQDVNVSGSFFIQKRASGSKTCARVLFVKSLSFLQKRSLSRSRLQSCFFSRVKTSRY